MILKKPQLEVMRLDLILPFGVKIKARCRHVD
jgi:hypothetical protein